MKTSLAGLLATFLLFSTACQKDDAEPVIPETFESIRDFWWSKSPTASSFTIDPTSDATLTTEDGSTIFIPANSLEYNQGGTVTSSVEIRWKPVFTKRDITFSYMYTWVNQNTILESGGSFFLDALDGNQQLVLADGAKITVDIPAQATSNEMELFTSIRMETPLEIMAWDSLDSSLVGNINYNSVYNSYQIQTPELGWCNVDRIVPYNQMISCNFTAIGLNGQDVRTTRAVAYFEEFNGVIPIRGVGVTGLNSFTIESSQFPPATVNILFISVVDERLYAGVRQFTPSEGNTYDIPIAPITEAELDALIDGL